MVQTIEIDEHIGHTEYLQSQPEFMLSIKPVPLLKNLLASTPEIQLTPNILQGIIHPPLEDEESLALVRTIRGVEITGLIPNFIRPGITAEKIQEILLEIEQREVALLKTFPEPVQNELLFGVIENTLTPQTLVALNEIWVHILNTAKNEYRNQNLIAGLFRQRLGHELTQTLHFLKNNRPFIHERICNNPGSSDDSPLYQGHPIQYLYTKEDPFNNLEVAIIKPNLNLVIVEDPDADQPEFIQTPTDPKTLTQQEFLAVLHKEGYTTAYELVRRITPRQLLRENENKISKNPGSPFWLLRFVGKASHPFIKNLTNWLRTQYDIKELIASPTLAKEKVKEYFEIYYGVQQLERQV